MRLTKSGDIRQVGGQQDGCYQAPAITNNLCQQDLGVRCEPPCSAARWATGNHGSELESLVGGPAVSGFRISTSENGMPPIGTSHAVDKDLQISHPEWITNLVLTNQCNQPLVVNSLSPSITIFKEISWTVLGIGEPSNGSTDPVHGLPSSSHGSENRPQYSPQVVIIAY